MNKFILVILLFLPALSNAVDWIDLGKSNDKQLQVYMDSDSIKYSNVRVIGNSSRWQSTTSTPEYISAVFQFTYINNNPMRKKGMYYTKQQWIISCENETYFAKSEVDYGFKDELISSSRSPKSILSSGDFEYAFPETVASNNTSAACSYI